VSGLARRVNDKPRNEGLSQAVFKCGLTPELTGAGGPTGPQGTNIGHQNREAMANVGVRVERFVRLGREVEGLKVAYYLHLLVLHLTCQSRWGAKAK
jgi:hypothetical protein